MPEDAQGFEEARNPASPWCWTCGDFVKWPGYGQCSGCLTRGRKPQDTVTFRTVHWDTAVLHAVIRRKVAQWEQACPGWELVPDFARYWEDATQPSKYVDRETSIGRKLAWTRFRVVRAHPRGRRDMGQVRFYPDVGDWQGALLVPAFSVPKAVAEEMARQLAQAGFQDLDVVAPDRDEEQEPSA